MNNITLYNRKIVGKRLPNNIQSFLSNGIFIVGIIENNILSIKTKRAVLECIKMGLYANIILITKEESLVLKKYFGVSIYPQLIVNGGYVGGGIVISEKIRTKEYKLGSDLISVYSRDSIFLSNLLKIDNIPLNQEDYNPIWTISKSKKDIIYGQKSGVVYRNSKKILSVDNWINKVFSEDTFIYVIGNAGKVYKVNLKDEIKESTYIHNAWLNCAIIYNKNIVVGTTNGYLLQYDRETLELINKQQVSDNEIWSIQLYDNSIVYGLNTGDIFTYNIENNQYKKLYTAIYGLTALKVLNEILYFSTINGDIGYIFEGKTCIFNTKYERIWDFDLITDMEVVAVSSSGYILKINLLHKSIQILSEGVYTSVYYMQNNKVLCGHSSGKILSFLI